MKRHFKAIVLLMLMLVLVACESEADVVNHNLSKSADEFEVQRRIVFFNGITDKYLLTIEGLCSLDISDDASLRVTCKTGTDAYKRHYLGLSDNVSYFVEQTDEKTEDPFRYKVIFKPENILPDIDVKVN